MRAEQPRGSVTLVFTDIEGSTRLLHELGTAGYKEALAEHRSIVRRGVRRREIAEIALRSRDELRGGRLLAAIRRIMDEVEWACEPRLVDEQDRLLDRLGELLSPDEFATASAEGAAMSLDEAIALGFETLGRG